MGPAAQADAAPGPEEHDQVWGLGQQRQGHQVARAAVEAAVTKGERARAPRRRHDREGMCLEERGQGVTHAGRHASTAADHQDGSLGGGEELEGSSDGVRGTGPAARAW